ncbi:SDR family oxidoreductase [Tepidiforma sp.]|uniref:SDR family NAD(P)-dependent oxidoreductase n=1 Tax=Tepidiforma sp. TaxID=2682230 RepID=UPI002ADE0A6C|nr:SDR family oxidoreductase [Tepidiforma sp.]
MARFTGKHVFVTGGGTGIGLACARRIAEEGGSVTIAGRRESVLQEAAAALGSAADYIVCDVASDASVEAALAELQRRHGRLHLAVNAAGTGTVGSVLNGPVSEFTRVLDTNLTGVYRVMQHEARLMRESGGGSIVNISSIAGTHTHRWMTAYCVAKAGLNMLTRCAADDLGEFRIRVNAVAPGLVPTDLAAGLVANEETVAEYLRRMPLARLGTTDDIANTVAFLLSDDADWVTGMVLPADGGHHLRQGPDLLHQFRAYFPSA